MGIQLSFLDFFDTCHRRQAIQSPLLALGSLEIYNSEKDIVSFAERHSYQNLLKNKTVRSLFHDRYGTKEYKDCDLNEKADIKLDLALPINKELEGTASTILDGGTLEHVFDVRQVLENIHQMIRLGGTIIHINPLTWFDHAFYNFSPKFFRSVVEANGYELLVEGFWLYARFFSFFGKQIFPRVYITYNGREHPEVKKKIQNYFSSSLLPAKSLYMISYKKVKDQPFKLPYDIH